MDREFWLSRWEAGQIGFHRPEVNPHLVRYGHALPKPEGARIFVPLCGKSVDLTWLEQQGYEVIGVELSELAVRDYFAARGLTPQVERQGELVAQRAGKITLYCGDFFALGRAQLGDVHAFYDRAALVALPPELRRRYADHLAALLPEPVTGLLVCFDYRQSEMNGPPFSVPEDEVRSLYEPRFKVELLGSHDILDEEPRFRQAGLTSLVERVFRLER